MNTKEFEIRTHIRTSEKLLDSINFAAASSDDSRIIRAVRQTNLAIAYLLDSMNDRELRQFTMSDAVPEGTVVFAAPQDINNSR